MSRIPDCRTDKYYNQKYLAGDDVSFVEGFDWCAEKAVESFFDNMDIYTQEFDIKGEDMNLVRFLENHPKIAEQLKESLLHYIEMQRDELITSMIDGMDKDLYEKVRKAVDEKEA